MTALAEQLTEQLTEPQPLGTLQALRNLPGVHTARELSRPHPVYPVAGALEPVFAHAGLARGQAAGMTGRHALTLGLAAAATATQEGSWCATVGVGEPAVAACRDLGIDLDHYVNVLVSGADWLRAVSILVESVDIVIARPPFRLTDSERRRLLAKVRERRMSLVILGQMPGTAESLTADPQHWHGTAHGTGRLLECRVQVHNPHTGTHQLLLPGPNGRAAVAADVPAQAHAANSWQSRRSGPRLVVHDGR